MARHIFTNPSLGQAALARRRGFADNPPDFWDFWGDKFTRIESSGDQNPTMFTLHFQDLFDLLLLLGFRRFIEYFSRFLVALWLSTWPRKRLKVYAFIQVSGFQVVSSSSGASSG